MHRFQREILNISEEHWSQTLSCIQRPSEIHSTTFHSETTGLACEHCYLFFIL